MWDSQDYVYQCDACFEQLPCWQAAPLPGIPKKEKGKWYCERCWVNCNVPIEQLEQYWETHDYADWEHDSNHDADVHDNMEGKLTDDTKRTNVDWQATPVGCQDVGFDAILEEAEALGISTGLFTRLKLECIMYDWRRLHNVLIDNSMSIHWKLVSMEQILRYLDSELDLRGLLNYPHKNTEPPVVHFLAQNLVYDAAVMDCLLSYEADINARNGNGQTALQYVVGQILTDEGTKDEIRSLESMFDTLIQYHADATEGEGNGCSMTCELKVAYKETYQETSSWNGAKLACIRRVCNALVEAGADLPWHPDSLMSCVRALDLEGVNLALIRLGFGGAKRCLERQIGGRTLLHRCAAQATQPGCPEIVEKLLQHGAIVNARTPAGITPLDLTLNCARQQIQADESEQLMRTVRLLVASSADLSAKHSWRTDNSFPSTKTVGARIAELLMDLGGISLGTRDH